MSNNLNAVLSNLRSEKVKERQEGLSSLRTTFGRDDVVANFDEHGDGKAWLVVFQAIFTAVYHEKESHRKKPTAAAQNRLQAAANAVRWLTERSVDRWNKKVSKALLTHLLQTMIDKEELRAPVALDYINTLRCIVSRQAHMDHLDDDLWVRMVELGFNVVLGDPLRRTLEDEGGEDEVSISNGSAEDDGIGQDEGDGDEDDDLPSTSTFINSKKRRLPTPRATTSKLQSKSKPNPRLPPQTSPEQRAFTALLAFLLRAPSAPFLSPSNQYLPAAILSRLHRFLLIYPTDTSLHEDYLLALSATLSHLCLNKKRDVEHFALAAWDGLVGLWGTKTKRLKEGLVSVLRVLFPFVTADRENAGWGQGVGKLWHLLDAEAESRWGVDGLSLESLRLEVQRDGEIEDGQEAFVKKTFKAGWHFDAGQALAWAILELQADCAEKLFLLSESVHSSTTPNLKKEGKRTKLENPITSLLNSIQSQVNTNVRSYHLQILLFFIDKHWLILHDSLQQDVLSTLLQFVAFDDGVIQSWIFMCFAAIAYIDGTAPPPPRASRASSQTILSQERSRDPVTWDPIWTHAVRRVNVPTVCRAACHVACTLLSYAKRLLTSHRVLLEVEACTKDLDVQGPPFPYDSVCAFLSQSLRVSSQDVRLYRMQLEEKVLSWLMDSWGVGNGGRIGRSKLPLYMISDVVKLLECICGFGGGICYPVARVLLPACSIKDNMAEEGRTRVIRDFLLDAELPPFRASASMENGNAVERKPNKRLRHPSNLSTSTPKEKDLVQPRGLERKVSTYTLKSLDVLMIEWEAAKEAHSNSTAENARRSIDVAVIALSFEALLVSNGTKSNRRVIQAACKLMASVMQILPDSRWTAEEKALIIMGLEPLIETGEGERWGDVGWEAMLPPDVGTGIKSQTLHVLRRDLETQTELIWALRREFQKIIWQNADVQDAFSSVIKTLRDVLRIVVGDQMIDSRAMDVDDKDGFGPIRITQAMGASTETRHTDDTCTNRRIAEICVSFLTVVPILQSSSGEATRDTELTDFVLGSADEKFFLLAPIFLDKVRQRVLSLNINTLDNFLDKLAPLLESYAYSRSERAQLLVTQFLHSTLPIWLQKSVATTDVGHRIRQLTGWLSGILRSKKIRYWRVRDAIIRFLDEYLTLDPRQEIWSLPDDDDDGIDTFEFKQQPAAILPFLGADEDIRVRFRAGVANARLFSIARQIGQDVEGVYVDVKERLTREMDNYEHMLTRMLTLGNIMVVSSAVRRAPYWHLLETCLHPDGLAYQHHIGAILNRVSERMGLASFSQLFEAYASQIAYSIRQAGLDFLRFPPHLLGYQDRRECAEKAFRAFTPTNVLAGGPTVAHGQKLFLNHCTAIQKTPADGILQCFGDIVGFQIVSWIDDNLSNGSGSLDGLEGILLRKTKDIGDIATFDDTLRQNADGIVAAILRTLGDQDFTSEGAIVQQLRTEDASGKAPRAFQAMTRYRIGQDFEIHEPNLPKFSTTTVLRALSWFHTHTPDLESRAISYHVLHELFADVHRSPLVNEQMRLLSSISLWVASHHDEFQDPTLLHTLIQEATSLLAQFDLAHAAQSVLEWAFANYRKVAQKDPHFPDILIRISCLAHDYARNEDTSVSSLGSEILLWIDSQALALCKVTSLRSQVGRALPAWPHQPTPELTQIHHDISSESLSALLGDYPISFNKFRLVRRLHHLAAGGRYDQEQFARADFWRLKECIPSADYLQDDDMISFASLLVFNGGRIHSFGSEQQPIPSIRSLHLRGIKKRPSSISAESLSPQHSIVLSLLAMLDGDDMSQVHVAYRTLRYLMTVSDIPQFQSWPSEHRTELQFLQTYRRIPGTRPLRSLNELSSEVYMNITRDFSQWISMFTILLSDVLASSDSFFAQLTPILQYNVSFAEQVLPVLIHVVLEANRSLERKGGLSICVVLSDYFTSILSSQFACVSCRRAVVDTVLHLRNFRPPHTGDPLAHDKWLELDYTLLARNAIACGAYTTALLFLELAAEYRDCSPLDDSIAEQILFDIYSHIDEPDGFYGIQTNDLRRFLIKRFHHEKQWEKAFRFHGADLEAGNTDATEAEGLLQSFHSFGFDHLAIDVLQSSAVRIGPSFNTSSMSYQLGWRTETWDLPDQTIDQDPGASLYLALRAIHRERDQQRAEAVIRHAFSAELGRLHVLGAENLTEIRKTTQNLMCLCQLTQWRNSWIHSLAAKRIDIESWKDLIHISGDFDFPDLENIMATRVSLIRSVRQKEERNQIGNLVTPFTQGLIDVEKYCLVQLSEAARDAHQIQIALNSIVRAQQLEKTPSFEVSQEFASVLWIQKEEKLAVQFLKELVSRDEKNIPRMDRVGSTRKALLLSRLGTWTSEACLEKPMDILAHYFKPAIALIASAMDKHRQSIDPAYASVCHQCAIFAEHQFHAIRKSPDAIRWKLYVDRKTREVQQLREEITRLNAQSSASSSNKSRELSGNLTTAEALLKEDGISFGQLNQNRDTFLQQAIDMYSRCLEVSDSYDDDSVIRLCSLWFANYDDVTWQDKIREALDRVPSRKFVFLSHQLSARLSSIKSTQLPKNQENLQSVLLRMCKEHPFHSLYQVYCLLPDRSSPSASGQSTRHISRRESPASQTDRASAAREIFNRMKSDPESRERATDVEGICDASLEWAKYPIKHSVEKKPRGPYQIPNNVLIRKITFTKVPVVTVRTPVDPTLRYDNCVWIAKYDLTFHTAGGVNLPKINICHGSDGIQYKQLFKGEGADDLRQDAVMEQVFDLVNMVLRCHRETRRRNLSIRDYKVVPLATQAGVLEFVGNTMPLWNWLHKAHTIYRPKDINNAVLKEQFKKKSAELRGRTELLAAYFLDIRKEFKPVMRHYFTERHKLPMSWFAMRLNYARSVATTSIVGHVLGLGDRHTSNILIDNITGEVVHIDLGIAFDQGKILKVPERVPFRMTADIVDGLGTSGTDGVFRRCAEETLRVLREGSEVIMTVLEVFKHDPLHSWTASELKVKQVQGSTTASVHNDSTRHGIGIDMSSGTADEAADRALSSVARKLDKTLSVEYTVNDLIAEATDIVNLASMFVGWAPYL